MKTLKKFVSVFSIALLGGIFALSLDHFYVQKQNQFFAEANVRNPLPVKFTGYNPSATPEGSVNFVDAAKKSIPAVVHIKSKVEMEDTRYNNAWDFFYGNPHQQQMEGMVTGSGVVVSSDGYIVTNNHVIEQAGKIEVTLSDRQTYTAKIVGRDPETDLALLKIDATNLPYMEYGNSDNVEVGQWVLAVGNPYNLTSTVTAGIISAKGRNIDILPNNDQSGRLYPIESYLQTDAAVNPGNSGGALVNTDGQLVGINSAIASTTGSYAGYSFAIPVNLVRKVVADLLQYGKTQRAFLGVTIRTVDADIAKSAGLDGTEGVYVDALSPNGAGEAAGIKQGDVILKVGDQPVNDVASLEEQIGRYRPGDKVNIMVNRDNKQVEIEVTLRNLEGTTSMIKPHSKSTAKGETVAVNELGASFGNITNEEKSQLNIGNGVKVVNLQEGKLRNIGVHKGFIITKIDHQLSS